MIFCSTATAFNFGSPYFYQKINRKLAVTSRHNVSAIEVKSGKNYTLSSLNKFRDKYSGMMHRAYIIHGADLRVNNDVVYLPLNMTMYL